MTTLEGMRYPTAVLAGLADHTYVRCCGGAKAWGCWGGKTGGTTLRTGSGSSRRAHKIAGRRERAGVTCYLVNGVCHQAANRVLLPAGITMVGARGYSVSVALFGTYGRPRGALGACRAPFHQHPGVSGDLPACVCPPVRATVLAEARSEHVAAVQREDATYLERVRRAYAARDPVTSAHDVEEFMARLFRLQTQARLPRLRNAAVDEIVAIRRSTERARMELERRLGADVIDLREFASAFDAETLLFQDDLASRLDADDYSALLGLAPGDRVTLTDPAILRALLQ